MDETLKSCLKLRKSVHQELPEARSSVGVTKWSKVNKENTIVEFSKGREKMSVPGIG